MATNQRDSKRKVKFNLEHRVKKAGKLRELDKKEEKFFRDKLEYFEDFNIAQFEQSGYLAGEWEGKLPGKLPPTLSSEVRDGPIFRVRFSRKMRVFVFRQESEFIVEFLVIWVDSKHKLG